MKKWIRALLVIVLCWALFVAVEGLRLIGSTDPGKYPLLVIGGVQRADQIADYQSLGFSQTYYLTDGDAFVHGEFRVLGIPVAKWQTA